MFWEIWVRWLVTGGAGFIGCSLIGYLQTVDGHQVRVLDNLSVGSREDLSKACTFSELDHASDFSHWADSVELVVGDILDEHVVRRVCAGVDVIVHLAANTGVAPSVENPMADCRTNVIGTLNMLEACRSQGVKRFVFASSGAPLGVQTPPLNEDMAPHPVSPYGSSKLAGEGYCSSYFHSFGVETVALRFGNVYGPNSGKKDSVVAKFIKRTLAGEVLEIYGDGGQTRDFIYIGDLVEAIDAAARAPGVGGEIFQIATARESTVSELTQNLVAALKAEGQSEPAIEFTSSRVGDVARNYSDTSKAARRLNWQAHVSLEDGLRSTVRYFLETSDRSAGQNEGAS